MPSIGHLAVGLAAGRLHAGKDGPRLRATLVLTGLALLPDVDGITLLLSTGPESVLRHRGASHSLLVAATAAFLVTAVVGGIGRSRWRMLVTALAVAASHGLLDALTHGAFGPMLLWPFSTERIFAPTRLMPASPLLPRLFTQRGVDVMLREAILFAPLILYGLWPRPRAPGSGGRGRPSGRPS